VRKALHLMFGGMTRSAIVFSVLVLLIAAGPVIAGWFDERGLPGGTIVFLGLALGTGASGFAFFFTMTPRRNRSRALRKLARELGLPYRQRVWLTRDVRALPSFQLNSQCVIHDGIEGYRGSEPLYVFSCSWSPEAYEPTRWVLCAATLTALSSPRLLIGPRHYSVDERPLFEQVLFESEMFDRIWAVRTDDHRLASTIVDQRMMAWLLEREPNMSFELAGPWGMTVTQRVNPEAPADLVSALDGFLEHLPHVAISELGRGN
jgi:hypothetical protein